MRKVISGLLTAVLLAVTVGVPVYKHTCHVFDRSELSFTDEDQCCATSETSETIVDSECCSLQHFSTALDYETVVKKSPFPKPIFVANAAALYRPITNTFESNTRFPVLRPPPLAHYDLLAYLQVYRL